MPGMDLLRWTTALLSLMGEGDEPRLPRSIADEYIESARVQESPQDDPAQDPLQPATRPRKEEFTPSPPERAPLEHPHDSLGGFFRTHFAAKSWEDNVWRDYLTEPEVLVPLGLGAGAAGISHWDKPLSEHLAGTLGDRAWIGNATMATLATGSLALGILFPGEGRNGWDNFWEEAEVMAVTGITTTTLKFVVPRTRPGGGNRSFPSGHTATAFAAASLIDDNSGSAFGIPAYGLASLAGYSRIETRMHYPSDVLAGAAIGLLSAQVLDHLHWGNGRQSNGIAQARLRLELEPIERGAMTGFSLAY